MSVGYSDFVSQYLSEERKTTEILNQDSKFVDRNSKLGPPAQRTRSDVMWQYTSLEAKLN
jgi:hypothetical protein